MSIEFYVVVTAIIATLATARVTRLLVGDKFPPLMKVRDKFMDWTEKRKGTRDYGLLAICAYCMAFWVALGNLIWAYFAGVLSDVPALYQDSVSSDWSVSIWFFVNAAFALAYSSAMTVSRDGDDD